MDLKALLKALFKVCSPERLMPVDSTVNEYLVITAEHTSFLQVLLAPMGHIF